MPFGCALPARRLDSPSPSRQVSDLQPTGRFMSRLRLTFACGPYDRTQAVRDGTIQVEGVDLNYVTMQPAEIFWRQLQFQEFDASEMSLSNYTSLVSTGNSPFIAIPVYPSRVFRHSATAISSSTPARASRPAPTSRADAAGCRNIP
jgi:hypothetical protein